MLSTWTGFAAAAPQIAAVFTRRHRATSNLCLLATLRSDGFPRISPMEPRFFDDRLWLPGMPGTTKFADLDRDPRFCLHTATVDTQVSDGDAKLWGRAEDCTDDMLRHRFATELFEDTGFDLRGQYFALFGAEITAASAVVLRDGHLDIIVWKPGEPEGVVRKH
ncbi:pyridoxamine 5'-phosphate oxidase family protein [Mycobacterium sp. 1423905.2]|uniref:pyridoxamine 5'-phosphate oxidase family protein n=1 Tax=Mycobacterium sp. 1423905.2 TaxID=1856859 RepID=UPI0007FFBAF7|nr:pyridoxamine 5'-phosphate oxidase family protein [Mycobacterium sp. 1423905.2]OBJ63003.1 pyridoxamine 5-phosphate oxidase [Mycobacterium sp. 1423905.2]